MVIINSASASPFNSPTSTVTASPRRRSTVPPTATTAQSSSGDSWGRDTHAKVRKEENKSRSRACFTFIDFGTVRNLVYAIGRKVCFFFPLWNPTYVYASKSSSPLLSDEKHVYVVGELDVSFIAAAPPPPPPPSLLPPPGGVEVDTFPCYQKRGKGGKRGKKVESASRGRNRNRV